MSIIDILLSKNLINKDDIRDLRRGMAEGETIDKVLIAKGVHPEDTV